MHVQTEPVRVVNPNGALLDPQTMQRWLSRSVASVSSLGMVLGIRGTVRKGKPSPRRTIIHMTANALPDHLPSRAGLLPSRRPPSRRKSRLARLSDRRQCLTCFCKLSIWHPAPAICLHDCQHDLLLSLFF